jgi:hypothetical protein
MNDRKIFNPSRRSFITTTVPACVLACLGSKKAFAFQQPGKTATAQEAVHAFDAEFGKKITFRQLFSMQYREFIQLAKALEQEWGAERTLEFLKKQTTAKMTEYGKRQAERAGDTGFESYVKQFRSGYNNSLIMDIVEDSAGAFELKVKECIWASTFRQADAGHIGYCSVCWGDYAWAASFNDKITLVRDKTLMQGDDCCNHRYVWKA